MIKFLLVGLLIYIGYRIILMLLGAKKTAKASSGNRDAGIETHRDPVCGVYVSDETAVVGIYNDRRIYFCSMNCLEKYREQLEP